MAKKGKEPAKPAAPAAAAASASASSNKAKKDAATKKPSAAAPKPKEDGDFIVFTNSDKESGSKARKPKAAAAAAPTEENDSGGPPKPTIKQIIGGASWTGKLPVNLLSEHCQKQKWERPDYNTVKTPDGFSVFVSLSARNPKTQELTRLPPFKLPPTHAHLAHKPTALEAKHVAATYALYRVCSMKNMHMTLPPDYRALWKEFEALKKQDAKEGKGWMYEADPFQALREREEARIAAEKKRKQQQAAREKAANEPGNIAAQAFGGGGGGGGGGAHSLMRGWAHVPKIEMGGKTRSQLEDLVRRESEWNPHGVVMPNQQRAAIVKELKELGFRQSHVEEAVEACKDREETLEWLLVHIPEDDLPRWALPEKYSAGVTVGATDLKREGAIKRLAQSGYSVDLCRKMFDAHGGDEGQAAEALQGLLLESGSGMDGESTPAEADPEDSWRSPEELWEEEMATLEASFGDHYTKLSPDVCQIRIESVINGPSKDVETYIQFRKSPHYPAQVTLSMVAALPAYIKLSIIKKALAYARESLQGEETKIYFVASWVQENVNDIIEKPGALREVAAVASAASVEPKREKQKKVWKRPQRLPKPINWTPDPKSKQEWLARRQTPELKKMIYQRETLPAWSVQDEVIQAVAENQVTIISGETGSGKSTQAVQFILDDLYAQGLGGVANIIVTQPRRISALGLADRVSDERCSRVGEEVGYSIRGESKTSNRTRITFVTTGVLLRRLQTQGSQAADVAAALADVSHVFIDEVHERSLDTDFLLSILRDVLPKRRDLKLVLMSATLDAAAFKDYFTADHPDMPVGLVEIAGRTYPVTDYYLDDVIRMTGFSFPDNRHGRYDNDDNRDSKPSSSLHDNNNVDPINKIIQRLGSRVNYDLLVESVRAIDGDLSASGRSGGILVFLPGAAEITRTCNALRSSSSSLHVLPLHASLETREQKRVFAAAPPGKRKVVVATNVAETSITIDDIVAVIDSGRVKETSFDPQNNMRKLEETWASRAACKQRRGRAGRVSAGRCYKLYTRNLELYQMAERPEPEIRRVPLEQLCLTVRSLGVRDVGRFLGRAPTPPETTAVEGALSMLRRMGALDGDELTALGRQLAMIPADLRCGKLMVYGSIFGCLDDCVTMAAILSTRSPFVSPGDRRDEAREARMRFASGGAGDLLTDMRAFQDWDVHMTQGQQQRKVRTWCDENFLSFQTLSDIASTRQQFYSALGEMGIIRPQREGGTTTTSSAAAAGGGGTALLRALTASAFSPQIARIQLPDKKFAASVTGAVELDPEAKTIRYFSRDNGRVFIHPSSTLFDSQGFAGSSTYLSYFSMISTSKIFIRDLTPFNPYTLLLFSGGIELDTQGRGLVVDGWLRLRGWARIGVLVSRLRGIIDKMISLRIDGGGEEPGINTPEDRSDDMREVVRTVVKLIELDGLDA